MQLHTSSLPTPTLQTSPQEPLPGKALDRFAGDPNFMTSLARGLTVLEAFTQDTPRMSISQVSARTGLSRAAVRRCLYTLSQLGYSGPEDGQKYGLRPKLLQLGQAYTVSSTLASAAQPILERMSSQLHESFSVATLDGDDIVYIARTQVQRMMNVDIHVGSRLPAFCTSMGRVLIAGLPADEIERYLARVQLKPYTTKTVDSIDKLRSMLRNVRRNGYAMCDQEYEVGLRSMAVPIYSTSGKVIATVNLSGNAGRMSFIEMQTTFLPHLRQAAKELSAILG